MRELRYASSSVFFLVILFGLYIAWQHIAPFIQIIVLVVVSTSLVSFVVLMGSVSLSIWRSFTVAGEVEKAKGKVRIPRKKAE